MATVAIFAEDGHNSIVGGVSVCVNIRGDYDVAAEGNSLGGDENLVFAVEERIHGVAGDFEAEIG